MPARFVQGSVVVATDQQRVVQIGRTTVLPGNEVVGVGERRRKTAAGEAAATVAQGQQLALVRGKQALAVAEVNGHSVRGQQHPGHRGVAS